ncbi:MAG: sulfatase, partial [Planctomyces sp.]|nr:sulfatase [Planctomyces sp.]
MSNYWETSRRSFLRQTGFSLGPFALMSLLNSESKAADNNSADLHQGVVSPPHHPPKVKRVIHLCMAGGPSHLETFDEKPTLKAQHGQPMPESLTKGQQVAQLQGRELKCFAPQFEFESFGESGQRVCSLFPQMGSLADDVCLVRSMHTDQINHDPA